MNTLDSIISISEKLFMKYGLKSISMDDIASNLGMSKKTIYKYIGTKDKLIIKTISIFLRRESKIVKNIVKRSSNAVEEFQGIANHLLKVSNKMKPAFIFDIKKYYPEAWEVVETYHFQFVQNTIKQNIERGIQEGLYRKDINSDVIAMLYVGKNLAMSEEEWINLRSISPKELMKQQLLYHLYGILSEEGLKKLEQNELEVF